MNTSPTNRVDVEKASLGRSLLVCVAIAVVYWFLAAMRMKKSYEPLGKTNIEGLPLSEEAPKQIGRAPQHGTLLSPSSTIDQPFLIDAGIIQVVLVIMAVAFTIRAFTIKPDSQAVLIFGSSFFFPTIRVDELANVVFIISGTISTALYAIYLWEWIDRNIGTSPARGLRTWLPVITLFVHLAFLFLLAAILILQVLTKNIIPAQGG